MSVWYNSVVRGDCNLIRIGDRSNIQDNCAIHVTVKTHPTILEEEVTLGHGAIVHGATVRKGALIGIRATVLDGADVGESAFIGAGALVTPRTIVPPAHALARRSGAPGARPLGRRGRGPEALPPQLPRLQRGVLPGRREVGAVSGRLRAPKGTHDLLPPDSERFAAVEATARRVFSLVRLRGDPHADLRVDGALRALGRRDDRHRPQGDVHVPGPQGPLADAAARRTRRASCARSSRRASRRRRGRSGSGTPARSSATSSPRRAATASSARSASSSSASRPPRATPRS